MVRSVFAISYAHIKRLCTLNPTSKPRIIAATFAAMCMISGQCSMRRISSKQRLITVIIPKQRNATGRVKVQRRANGRATRL